MKKSLLQIHTAVALWGFTGVLGRAISLSAPILVWYRMGLTAIILFVIFLLSKQSYRLERKDIKRVVFVGASFAVHWVAFYSAIKLANASVALICLSTSGVFTAILDPIINKTKFEWREVLLGCFALVGVYLMVSLPQENMTTNAATQMVNYELGVALGVLAAVISAVFSICNKPIAQRYDSKVLVFWEMFVGFTLLTMAAPFYIHLFPQEILIPQGWDYLWIIILAYFCTVVAQSLSIKALRELSPFTVAFSVNLEPVYGILLAFLLYKENQQLGLGFYVGMGLIALSVVLQSYFVMRKSKV